MECIYPAKFWIRILEGKPRVLVVDGDPAPVAITKHKLLQHGYDVLTAQNGKDALELVESEFPDLVISKDEEEIIPNRMLIRNYNFIAKDRGGGSIVFHKRMKKFYLLFCTFQVDLKFKNYLLFCNRILLFEEPENTILRTLM